ncbi:MAG: hypothetical protein V4619_07425 [Bacteroidota bacterium]
MNSITKKIGIAAVAVALICNLQYSFYSAKENPSAAKAGWTDAYGVAWCGAENSTEAYPGTWTYLPTDEYSYYHEYDFYELGYIWYFVRDNYGTYECGPNEAPSSYNNYNGYYVTVPKPEIYF